MTNKHVNGTPPHLSEVDELGIHSTPMRVAKPRVLGHSAGQGAAL